MKYFNTFGLKIIQMFYRVFTSETCIPLPVVMNGAFSSSGVTVTTNIVSDLKVGQYLYSTTNNEVRKVMSQSTDKKYTIESAFAADVVSDPIRVTDDTVVYTKAIITNFEKVNGKLNEQTLFARTEVEIDKGDIAFTIDGTGTSIGILLE